MTVDRRDDFAGLQCFEVRFAGAHSTVPAWYLVPETGADKAPVLYAHAHGNRFDIGRDEVLNGRPALMDPPLGIALAQAGHAVLCPDMVGFGSRQGEGTEAALAKAALWNGRCLLGDMLADLAAALDVLPQLPGGASGPAAAVGLSMGATLAYWLGALEPRVQAVAHLCAFADMGPLIAQNAHDLHGIYMTVPGLLTVGDLSDVAAMIAPRPQLVGVGRLDPLTPPQALDPALHRLRRAYADVPDGLVEVIEDHSGHEETPAMRRAVIAMLAKL